MKHLLLALLLLSPAFAQGPQTPPAAPGPTQRSLQEIWDALAAQRSVIETNRSNLATTTSLQDSISTSLGDLAATGLTDDTAGFDFFTIAEGTGIGRECVLTILTSGEIVAAFLDETQNDLKITRNGTGSWVTQTIDFNARGPLAITEDENGHPSVLFFNPGSTFTYASTFNGTSWQQSQVSVGVWPSDPSSSLPTNSSYTFASDGRTYAAWKNNGDLIFTERIGGVWEEEVLIDIDPSTNTTLAGISIAVLPNDEPVVAVFQERVTPGFMGITGTTREESILLLRRNTNGTWTSVVVEATSGTSGGIAGSIPSPTERGVILSPTFLNTASDGFVTLGYDFIGNAERTRQIEIPSGFGGSYTANFPAGGYERMVFRSTWDVTSEPINQLGSRNTGNSPYERGFSTESGSILAHFIDRSLSYVELSYSPPFIYARTSAPLISASPWNSKPVEVCGFARPDGRIAVAIRRPFENDFIIAVEKP